MCGKHVAKRVWVATIGLLIISGCHAPLTTPESGAELRRSVEAAVERELSDMPDSESWLETTQPRGEVEETLAERRDELHAIGPTERTSTANDLGPDLTGAPQTSVAVTLESAVRSAVANNLSVQRSQLQPGIAAADVVAAEAVFDALLFSNVDFSKTDEPTTVPVIMGVPLGTGVTANESYRFETGIRRRLTSGGEVSISTDLTRTSNNAPGLTLSPDPAYVSAIRLAASQPLLRGFGSDVNTAAIRINRNLERRSIQELKGDLLAVVEETEAAYWDLVFSWNELAIRQWLVEVGLEVREVLARRLEFDTRQADYSDAVATVEQRKSEVIRARRRLRQASDILKLLLNDPEITVGSEVILAPVDELVEAPISYNLRSAMLTAISNRPEIQQAILDIDDASIRQMVADNGRLPLLNLAAEMNFVGLDDDDGDSYGNLTDGDFIDYVVGLTLEVPVGNRGADAEYRKARLQRSAAVIQYRKAVQNAVADVKGRLRDVITNYELIQATRSNRIAQAENLRTLLVEEETLASLTPEFLNLKFNRQDRLALARADEVQALVNFDQAVAALHRAMGIGLDMNGITMEIVDDPDDAARR